jgi:hypothetical protein
MQQRAMGNYEPAFRDTFQPKGVDSGLAEPAAVACRLSVV